MTKQAVDKRRYCGIVFIGHGSSYCYAATEQEAAEGAAKFAKADWSKVYQFKRRDTLVVLVYDMKDHTGWYADTPGVVKSHNSGQEMEPVRRVKVTV